MANSLKSLPAFPEQGTTPFGEPYTTSGMTLRDWFAGQALCGFLANPNADLDWVTKHGIRSAWNAADRMLTARGEA